MKSLLGSSQTKKYAYIFETDAVRLAFTPLYRCIMQKRNDGINRVKVRTPATRKKEKSLMMVMMMRTTTTSSRMGKNGWTAMKLTL